jgi:hypothetical protein
MDAITAVVVETGGRGMSPDTITTIALAVLTVVGSESSRIRRFHSKAMSPPPR